MARAWANLAAPRHLTAAAAGPPRQGAPLSLPPSAASRRPPLAGAQDQHDRSTFVLTHNPCLPMRASHQMHSKYRMGEGGTTAA